MATFFTTGPVRLWIAGQEIPLQSAESMKNPEPLIPDPVLVQLHEQIHHDLIGSTPVRDKNGQIIGEQNP